VVTTVTTKETTMAKMTATQAAAARADFLAARPDFAVLVAGAGAAVHAKNMFVSDVLFKLATWGSLSDKQVAAATASMQRDLAFAAKRVADAKDAGPAPSGRVSVTGEVLTVKYAETRFGSTKKMLVRLANASKVWVTVPAGSGIAKGDTVTVVATFTVAKDDPTFAFGSRPTFVSRVPAPAPDAPDVAAPVAAAADLAVAA
jgi:hypothetical protein